MRKTHTQEETKVKARRKRWSEIKKKPHKNNSAKYVAGKYMYLAFRFFGMYKGE